MGLNRAEKTLQLLERRLRQNPDDRKCLFQLAGLYFQSGRFDTRAREIYERALSYDPREAKFQNALSVSLLLEQISNIPQEIKQISEADRRSIQRNIEHIQLMVERQPENESLHQALANLLLFIGEVDQAIEHYKICLKLGSPKIKNAINFFKFIYLSGMPLNTSHLLFFAFFFKKNDELELALHILLDLYHKGELSTEVTESLVELLQLFISQLSEHDDENSRLQKNEFLRLLTDIYLQRNELFHALQIFSQLEIKRLRDYSTVKNAAQRLIHFGDFRGAFDLLSQIPLDDEAKALINQMTLQLENRGELDTATYLLQFLNENDITIKEISEQRRRQLEIRAEVGLGMLYLKKKQYEKSLQKFLSAINHGFEDIEEISEQLDFIFSTLTYVDTQILKLIASLYLKRKNYFKAADYYNSILQRQPEDKESLGRLREIYGQILAHSPNLGEIRIKSGDLFLMEGNVDNALTEYQLAANCPFTSFRANKKIAEVCFKSGNLKLALEKYKSLPIDEDDLALIYNILQAFINNEEFMMAMECAELIQGINPEFRDIAKILDYLRQREREYLTAGAEEDDKMRELIGEHAIGRYQLVSKIASGGMGVLYKVFDRKLQKFAAMKILREELSSSDRALERFFREARIAASIKHPNIVDIYDFNISHTAGQSYISMEYIEGRSLRQIIEDKFTFSHEPDQKYMAEILYYISQLCSALDATHKKGIVHRDIKPDNLMITKEGLVKITDFGIAHIERATLTPAGAQIGTPRYMSPEQVRGAKIDCRADIYGVGIVLYECLLGSPPFIAGDIAYQQVNIDPPQPREIIPKIPPPLNNIIVKCLKKNPDERYQTVAELKNALDCALAELGGYEPPLPDKSTTPEATPATLITDLDL